MTIMQAADPLCAPFTSLCAALRGLRAQSEALTEVHDAIGAFNEVFGRFQNAMALHASCLSFPQPKPSPRVATSRATTSMPLLVVTGRPSGIPKPQVVVSTSRESAMPAAAAHEELRESTAASRASVAPPPKHASSSGRKRAQATARARAAAAAAAIPKRPERTDTAPWKWDKNLRDAIPRKYQSEGELHKLENILIYLKNRHSGITIADLVTHSGLAVIRCKEILQTLTKLNLISRRQETAGFIYTFGNDA